MWITSDPGPVDPTDAGRLQPHPRPVLGTFEQDNAIKGVLGTTILGTPILPPPTIGP